MKNNKQLNKTTTPNVRIRKNAKQVNENIITNTSIKDPKQVNKNTTTNSTRMNVNKIQKQQ